MREYADTRISTIVSALCVSRRINGQVELSNSVDSVHLSAPLLISADKRSLLKSEETNQNRSSLQMEIVYHEEVEKMAAEHRR